jgi:hypothetical protein
MTTRTLYRAADSDYLSDVASFAAELESARAYTDDRGFGGRALYSATVEYADEQVLDVRSERDDEQCSAVLASAGLDRESCGESVDVLLADPRVVDALTGRGYRWVLLLDSYPEGSETWTWLGVGDEPELELIP